MPTAFDDSALQATWALYDQTGIRPEWILPVWHLESGLDASKPNAEGYPYYGLNQIAASTLSAQGIDPASYLTWSAADQISKVISPWLAGVQTRYGPMRSATRVYQGNFLPATLPTVRGLSQIVAPYGTGRGSSYAANANALDPLKHGAITLSDLAYVMSLHASSPAVRAALARAYQLRPNEKPHGAVYGDDLTDPLWGGLALGALAAIPFWKGLR